MTSIQMLLTIITENVNTTLVDIIYTLNLIIKMPLKVLHNMRALCAPFHFTTLS